jgi:outer membrane protein assembly factor BamB
MIRSLSSLVLAICVAIPCVSRGVVSAAQLHEVLPADSTERNGEPQALVEHTARVSSIAALPGGGVHPNAAVGLERVYSGTPIDVTTYHYDTLRTGWNQHETDLTPATVGSKSFGLLTTLNVDGEVLVQPLIISNFTMADGPQHNVLLVATAHNSVYAFDAQNNAQLWTVNFGASQSTNDVGCSDVYPEYGDSSTPVIVRTAGNKATVYIVAATEPAAFSFHEQLHALDLRTGADLVQPVEIAPKNTLTGGHTLGLDPQHQWNRAGLAYGNQSIYVAIGSHCELDPNRISGWMLRYRIDLLPMHGFSTIRAVASTDLASIWMAGFAPAIDRNGNVFAVTGNGNFNPMPGAKGYGESVVSLSADLTRVNSSFTPSAYPRLNSNDRDFGSGGVMLPPIQAGQKAPPMAVAMGKDSALFLMFLMSQNGLGGLQGTDKGPLQALQIAGNGTFGGPAYYRTVSGGRIFYQTGQDVLRAYTVQDGATPKLIDIAEGTSTAGLGGSIPVVSSRGQAAGTGIVWLVCRGATEQLEAYDAVKLGAPIFAANGGVWVGNNTGRAYVAPLVANGRVYVGAYKTVTVFGLTN